MSKKRNHVSVHVIEAAGRQLHVEVNDGSSLAEQLVTAWDRAVSVYADEHGDEIDAAITRLKELTPERAGMRPGMLFGIVDELVESAPVVTVVPSTRCRESHEVSTAAESTTRWCVKLAGHGIPPVSQLHRDPQGRTWRTGNIVKAQDDRPEISVTGERVTVNPDGTAEVKVVIDGVLRTYVEVDVHLPSSQWTPLDELDFGPKIEDDTEDLDDL